MPLPETQMSFTFLLFQIGNPEHPITTGDYLGIDRSSYPQPLVKTTPTIPVSGVCQFCGCHGESCLDRSGDRCGWTDFTQTCCTAEACRARLPKAPKMVVTFCDCLVCCGLSRGRCHRRFPHARNCV